MLMADLDALVLKDYEIKFLGREWILPGELPVKLILQLLDGQQKLEQAPEKYNELWPEQMELIYQVLKRKNPTVEKSFLEDNLTLRQLAILIGLFLRASGDNPVEQFKASEAEKKQEAGTAESPDSAQKEEQKA